MNMKTSSLLSILIFCLSMLGAFNEAVADPTHITVTRAGKNQIISIDEFDHFPFASGDILSLYPPLAEKGVPTTPDGHKHVLNSSGEAVRIPQQMLFIPFKEYQIPEHLCILTGAGL